MQQPRIVAIIGAGFSGTMVAVNLLRESPLERLRIVLIDRTGFARGTAYAEREYPYLLNVPAGRMSATSSDPEEFLAFARHRLPSVSREDFLPRALYGQYLRALLREAESTAAPSMSLETLLGDATRIERIGTALRVHLAGERALDADEVVLAPGNPPPARVPGAEHVPPSMRYIQDPWNAPLEIHPGESLLVLGAGLTMADVAVAAAHRTAGRVVIHALSRHGLSPLAQSSFGSSPGGYELAPFPRTAPHSMRALVRMVRFACTEIERQGGDWREAITQVRARVPALWQQLPFSERARFLRHARSVWDVHRHRLPEQTLGELQRLRAAGRLQIHAGRLLGLSVDANRVRASWRARGTQEIAHVDVDRVINCTGPDCDPRRSDDALIASLLAEGIAVCDPFGLGLRTAGDGALIDRRGRAAPNLYYIGPMLRADHWEATAVPELRGHAERLARHLLGLHGSALLTAQRAM